ncbi:hypothetical protein ACFOGI_14710 [Virgibacillus xinjiangensis]|uniref:Uncharacterized protein n=1 Tax=Virgibacillus xinjiangensis TaxID=393090 RepID=A0ABV7CYC8_9BACI
MDLFLVFIMLVVIVSLVMGIFSTKKYYEFKREALSLEKERLNLERKRLEIEEKKSN